MKRRSFLSALAALTGGTALAKAIPPSMSTAVLPTSAQGAVTIDDVFATDYTWGKPYDVPPWPGTPLNTTPFIAATSRTINLCAPQDGMEIILHNSASTPCTVDGRFDMAPGTTDSFVACFGRWYRKSDLFNYGAERWPTPAVLDLTA